MVDEILPDSVVPAGREGDLELGTDTIDTRDEHRVAILARVEREQPAEATNFAKHLGALG